MGSPAGAVHMAADRLGCKEALVGTGWANSRPSCMNGLRKRHSPFTSSREGSLGSEWLVC